MGTHATTARRLRHPAFAAAFACALLAAPGSALALAPHGSGGDGLPSGSGSSKPPPNSGGSPVVRRVNALVSAHGHGITLTTRAAAKTGNRLRFTGTANSAGGRVLEIDFRVGRRNWHRVAQATVATDKTFDARWRVRVAGRLRFRAVLVSSAGGTSTNSGATSVVTNVRLTPALRVTVFRTGRATYYGPGLWGNHTACGQRLRRRTLGVASRTMRCGTKIGVYYHGKEIVVPVVDRGPYGRHHARWDLTMATARALGIKTSVKVGALRVH